MSKWTSLQRIEVEKCGGRVSQQAQKHDDTNIFKNKNKNYSDSFPAAR